MIFTVFFTNNDPLPLDFPTYKEAKEAADELVEQGLADGYEISSTTGEVI